MGICSLPSEQCAATTWVCFKRYIDKGQVRTTASRLHSPVGPRRTRTRTRNLTRTPTRPRSPYFQGSRSIPILVYGNVYRFAVYAYDSGPNKKQMVWISALPLPTPMVRSNTPPRPLRGGSQDGEDSRRGAGGEWGYAAYHLSSVPQQPGSASNGI